MPLDLDKKIGELLSGMPEELQSSVRGKLDFYKSKECFSNRELYKEAEELVELEMLAYVDARSYLSMYNRRWAEHLIFDALRAIVRHKSYSEEDLFSVARLNLDLNGLKALNDLGGHAAGNEGLKIFSELLKNGRTTQWLRGRGLQVTATAEGGDEFGVVILGGQDLRSDLAEIEKKYSDETWEKDVKKLVEFGSQQVREKLKNMEIEESVPPDFEFKISTSVGSCTLGEAIAAADVPNQTGTYNEVAWRVVKKMFEVADHRSIEHKSQFKRELGRINPLLSALYARLSKEVLHLENEINKLNQRVKELGG